MYTEFAARVGPGFKVYSYEYDMSILGLSKKYDIHMLLKNGIENGGRCERNGREM